MLVYLQLMQYLKIFILGLSLHCGSAAIVTAQSNETTLYYAALASKELAVLDEQLSILNKSNPKVKAAYEGALRMKRAGLLKGPANKLKEFKAGKEQLEKEISAHPGNAEFRFLRIMIQENAPKILGYHDDVEADLKILQQQFTSLPAPLQTVILDYSKTSRTIKTSDFKI